jgi:hypothetical protein
MDKTDLKRWLNARPEETRQRDAALIAMRAAARVFPLAYRGELHGMSIYTTRTTAARSIQASRCLLTVPVVTVFPRAETKLVVHIASEIPVIAKERGKNKLRTAFAALSAKSAARAAALGVSISYVGYACEAVYEASFGHPSTWINVQKDIEYFESDVEVLNLPLFDEVPDWFDEGDNQMRQVWASDPDDVWDFWTRWWEGVVQGEPLDWAFQEKVALIPAHIWKQGAAAVARAIKNIEEGMTPLEPSDTDMEKVIEQTRHGAVLFYDPDTKLIGEEAVSTLPQDVRRDVVDLMQDVLSGFPAASAGNNIYELIRRERDILKRAIDAYQARPWMLLTSLRRARAGVQDKVADGTCPQNDPLLNDLVAQIVQAEVLLISHDAELAVAVRNQERLPDVTLTAEDLHLLTAGMQALQGHATPELSIVIDADLAAIADTNLPIPHRKAAMLSTIARLVQVRALATGKAKRSLFGNSRFGVAEVASWVTIFDGIARVLTASGAWEWILVVIQRLL